MTLDATQDNELFPRPRIPVCSTDTSPPDYSGVTWNCKLYQANGVTKVADLTRCLIPANTMVYPDQYKLKITVGDTNSNMDNSKWVVISIEPPKIFVGIKGNDRVIDTRVDNELKAVIVPSHLSSTLIYKWRCYDTLYESNCFSTDYQYLQLPNAQTANIPKSMLFPDRVYIITLIVTETTGSRVFEASTTLYGSNTDRVPVMIESEANLNLYLDVERPNTFSAKITNTTFDALASSTFIWTVKDQAGVEISSFNYEANNNHLTIPEGTLKPENYYSIEVNVT